LTKLNRVIETLQNETDAFIVAIKKDGMICLNGETDSKDETYDLLAGAAAFASQELKVPPTVVMAEISVRMKEKVSQKPRELFL